MNVRDLAKHDVILCTYRLLYSDRYLQRLAEHMNMKESQVHGKKHPTGKFKEVRHINRVACNWRLSDWNFSIPKVISSRTNRKKKVPPTDLCYN